MTTYEVDRFSIHGEGDERIIFQTDDDLPIVYELGRNPDRRPIVLPDEGSAMVLVQLHCEADDWHFVNLCSRTPLPDLDKMIDVMQRARDAIARMEASA